MIGEVILVLFLNTDRPAVINMGDMDNCRAALLEAAAKSSQSKRFSHCIDRSTGQIIKTQDIEFTVGD